MTCIFCDIANYRTKADIVRRDDEWVAFRDIHPQAPTHILVVPVRHIETVNDLAQTDATLVGRLVLAARDIARDEGIAQRGYRLVFNCNREAGQSVWHLHLHLLGGRPMRWPPG
jgi:histidine triad (HIT) family protein